METVQYAVVRGACEVEFFGAQCRQDEPDVEICLSETPLSQQIKGLNSDLYDAGFAQSDEVGEGILAEAIWSEPLVTI